MADLRELADAFDAGERFRPAAPRAREDLEALSRAIADGTYRVEPRKVADAMLRPAPDPPARPD